MGLETGVKWRSRLAARGGSSGLLRAIDAAVGSAAMRSLLVLASASLLLASVGCGARSDVLESDPAPLVAPVELFAPDGAGCVASPDLDQAASLMARQSGQGIAVVDIVFALECTNLGGDYVLGREIGGTRMFWLGGHGCSFLTTTFGPGLVYGVVRYTQTAALFQISSDVCVGFPDQAPGAQTDVTTEAIALFERLEEAQAFAGTL